MDPLNSIDPYNMPPSHWCGIGGPPQTGPGWLPVSQELLRDNKPGREETQEGPLRLPQHCETPPPLPLPPSLSLLFLFLTVYHLHEYSLCGWVCKFCCIIISFPLSLSPLLFVDC